MRVVETDNFNGDYPDESYSGPAGLTEEQAKKRADQANNLWSGQHAPRYWKVVDDDYELLPGFEP